MLNLKLRLQNKATLTALASVTIAFIYQILALVGITPSIGENEVTNIVAMVLTLLTCMGVLVDPTTAGIRDSVEAMNYDEPKQSAYFETAEDAGLLEPADRSDEAEFFEEDDSEEALG